VRKLVLLAISSGVLFAGCMAMPAAGRSDLATSTPTSTATATASSTATATATASVAEPNTPPSQDDATPTPTLLSEVLSDVQPPQPTPVRGGTTLVIPDGTTVVHGSCASDGECHWYNFYWAPTHEAVVQLGESQIKEEHELCHAHQHWSINGGAPLSPSGYDLHDWFATTEGGSFSATVVGLSWPWSHSAINDLEDFAWTCAYWYLDPAYLLQVSPDRYDWAAQNLP
jgi:hypothetical protein